MGGGGSSSTLFIKTYITVIPSVLTQGDPCLSGVTTTEDGVQKKNRKELPQPFFFIFCLRPLCAGNFLLYGNKGRFSVIGNHLRVKLTEGLSLCWSLQIGDSSSGPSLANRNIWLLWSTTADYQSLAMTVLDLLIFSNPNTNILPKITNEWSLIFNGSVRRSSLE